jgi:hypothetical protein
MFALHLADRVVRVDHLTVENTYGGLQFGFPRREINQFHLNNVMGEAGRRYAAQPKVTLIPPVIRIEPHPRTGEGHEVLPLLTWVLTLSHPEPVFDPTKSHSWAVVVCCTPSFTESSVPEVLQAVLATTKWPDIGCDSVGD